MLTPASGLLDESLCDHGVSLYSGEIDRVDGTWDSVS